MKRKFKLRVRYVPIVIMILLCIYIVTKWYDIKYNSPSEFITDEKTDEIMIRYQNNLYHALALDVGRGDVAIDWNGDAGNFIRNNNLSDYLPALFRKWHCVCGNDPQHKYIYAGKTGIGTLYTTSDEIERLTREKFLSQGDLKPDWKHGVVTSIYFTTPDSEDYKDTIEITDKEDINFLLSLKELNTQRVKYLRKDIHKCVYQGTEYYNSTPVCKTEIRISIINNHYIIEKNDEETSENTNDFEYVIGSMINDDSQLEAIKVNGAQVFTKDNGITIDNLKYLD